jgi:hypothetical protein
MTDDRYDQDTRVGDVLYDEIRDGFICAYCLDDFSITQLHATYGGNTLPIRLQPTRKLLGALRNEPCLICDLPCSRFAD